MDLAIQYAWRYQILTYPNPPVGALVLDRHGKIVAIEAHKKAGEAHAEVLALKNAFLALSDNLDLINKLKTIENSSDIHAFLRQHHNNIFADCTLFVTLEPCAKSGKTPACAPLIIDLGISKVMIGALDPNAKMAGGARMIRSSGIEVIAGICKDGCERLIDPFKRWQNGTFLLYKWASRLSGSIDNGQISGEQSQKHMHAIRSKCDAILISGKTVRNDRPTLDARLVAGRAPDVVILSKSSDFDKSIPLFNLPHRKVIITNDIEIIGSYNFVLAEGGSEFLGSIWSKADYFLHYQNSSLKAGQSLATNHQLELAHASRESDLICWYNKI